MAEDAAESGLGRLIRLIPMRGRLLIALGSLLCAVGFSYAARSLRIPEPPGLSDAAAINSASTPVNLLAMGVVLVVCALAGTVVAGSVRFDAGLVCAVVGLSAISLRTARMGDLLRQNAGAGNAGVVLRMVPEIVLIYGLVGVAWLVIRVLQKSGFHRSDEAREGIEQMVTKDPLPIKLAALGMNVGITGLVVLLLAATDAKMQVLGAVFVASFVGAAITHHLYPVSPSPWFWVAPMFVGIVGYLVVYLKLNPVDPVWKTGHLTVLFAPLARPLPLDYATAGTAGAILGYWMGRSSQHQQLLEAAESETVIDAFRKVNCPAPSEPL